MKYLVIGAGGTGGSIAAYMTKAGKDVTVIARGKHLDEIDGLIFEVVRLGRQYGVPVPTYERIAAKFGFKA